MSFDTLFVPVLSEDQFKQSFYAALSLARVHHSHIAAVHVIDKYPVTHDHEFNLYADSIQAYEADKRARAEQLEAAFYTICRDEKIPSREFTDTSPSHIESASWQSALGYRHETMALLARQTDLSVLALHEDTPEFPITQMAEELLGQSGHPILFFPKEFAATPLEKILVAWNGSIEATRAISLAEPLLKSAKHVQVLAIGALGNDIPKATEMALYLERKGIHATGKDLPNVKASIEDQITLEAEDMNADLLVMGAYSHARWREVVLGGVTKTMLLEPPLPLFLAH